MSVKAFIKKFFMISAIASVSACEPGAIDNKVEVKEQADQMQIQYIEITREQSSEWYLPFGSNVVRFYDTETALKNDMNKGFSVDNMLNDLPGEQYSLNHEKFMQFINKHVDFKKQDMVLFIGVSGGPPLDDIVYSDIGDGQLEFCTQPPESLIQGKALLQLVGLFVMPKQTIKSVKLCEKLNANAG